MSKDEEVIVLSTLKLGEPHPAALIAYQYITSIPNKRLLIYLATFSGMSGNRLGEVCSETLRRVLHNETVNDRYLMGLAWGLKNMEASRDK